MLTQLASTRQNDVKPAKVGSKSHKKFFGKNGEHQPVSATSVRILTLLSQWQLPDMWVDKRVWRARRICPEPSECLRYEMLLHNIQQANYLLACARACILV